MLPQVEQNLLGRSGSKVVGFLHSYLLSGKPHASDDFTVLFLVLLIISFVEESDPGLHKE